MTPYAVIVCIIIIVMMILIITIIIVTMIVIITIVMMNIITIRIIVCFIRFPGSITNVVSLQIWPCDLSSDLETVLSLHLRSIALSFQCVYCLLYCSGYPLPFLSVLCLYYSVCFSLCAKLERTSRLR